MKRFLFFIMTFAISLGAIAQTSSTGTVHGAVVDKNGNPLVGAEVSATGGAETTLVDSDGTFTLEVPVWLKSVTASYAGYESKKMKTSFEKPMVFRLNKYKARTGFLNLSAGLDIESGYPTLGIRGGILAKWGFYGNLMVGLNGFFGSTLTLGGIKSITKNFFFYFGCGLGMCTYYDEWDEISITPGMAYDAGFIFKIGRHFDMSLGYIFSTDFDNAYAHIPNLSLGYVF